MRRGRTLSASGIIYAHTADLSTESVGKAELYDLSFSQ